MLFKSVPSPRTSRGVSSLSRGQSCVNQTVWQMSKTPTLIWAQRVEKVFVTWECLATKEVNVTFSEGLLTVEGTLENGEVYKLENLPLFLEIEPDGSKWFKNDRCSSHSPLQLLVSGSGSCSGPAVVQPPSPFPCFASRAGQPHPRCATCPGLW